MHLMKETWWTSRIRSPSTQFGMNLEHSSEKIRSCNSDWLLKCFLYFHLVPLRFFFVFCTYVPLSMEILLGLWPAVTSEEGIITCRNVKYIIICWIICFFLWYQTILCFCGNVASYFCALSFCWQRQFLWVLIYEFTLMGQSTNLVSRLQS